MSDETALSDDVIAEIRANRKVNAIKLVRKQQQIGLKEAKELVDTYIARHPYTSGQQSRQSSGTGKGWILLVVALAVAYGMYRQFA